MATFRSAVTEIQEQLGELRALTYMAQGENLHEHTDQIQSQLNKIIKIFDAIDEQDYREAFYAMFEARNRFELAYAEMLIKFQDGFKQDLTPLREMPADVQGRVELHDDGEFVFYFTYPEVEGSKDCYQHTVEANRLAANALLWHALCQSHMSRINKLEEKTKQQESTIKELRAALLPYELNAMKAEDD